MDYDAGYCRVTGTVQDKWTECLKSRNLWIMVAGYCRVTGTPVDYGCWLLWGYWHNAGYMD